MRKYQVGGIKKPKPKPAGSMDDFPNYGKTRPGHNILGKPKYQVGGKKLIKRKATENTDEYGNPISGAEAKRRDEALTKSLQGYAGTAYVKKQMGVAKKPVVKKKAEKGTSLGMKSVKAGYDKNPGVTRADIIVAAKGKAKRGTALKKGKGGISMTRMANLKKGGKTAKCKYGCK
jgi:hypothetical protein